MEAEVDLMRLRRQYRIMEKDRKSYLEDALIQVGKQRHLLDILQREELALREELSLLNSRTYKRKSAQTSAKVRQLSRQYHHISENLAQEQCKLQELRQKFIKAEKELTEKQSALMTDAIFLTRLENDKKRAQRLENQLDHTMKRFGGLVTKNSQMRLNIDHLLKERADLNEQWERKFKRYNIGKRRLFELIELAIVAFDKREEWDAKLQSLRMRTDVETETHITDMQELERQLDLYADLRDFLTTKCQVRILRDLRLREEQKNRQAEGHSRRQEQQNREMLQQIQKLCQEQDVERIAGQFQKQEEENFALFSYVNELSHELDKLQTVIENNKILLEQQKQDRADIEHQRDEDRRSLELHLQEASAQLTAVELKVNESEHELNTVLELIRELFGQLFGSEQITPLLDVLDKDKEVNRGNAMIFVGLIEDRIRSLVTSMVEAKSPISNKSKRTESIT